MKTRDLKSLCETIATTVEATQPKQLAEGYINSLTEKARQVYSSINEEKDEDEKEESPAEEKAEDKAEMLMKRLAAKALKRAKKKAATNEEVELAEKAAPGYEDWASDPKVKASFKKQYGKDWKQVMYGRSWNMKKMDEETLDEAVSAKRMRIIRKYVKGNKRVPAHLKDYMERSFKKKRFKDKQLSDGRGAVGALETRMRRKSAALRAKGVEPKGVAPGYLEEELAESMQLDELTDTLLFRARAKAKGVGKFKVRKNPSFAGSSKDVPLHTKITKELQRRGSVPVSESEQLDEAGYKRLMRLKKAAYKADLASRNINPKTPKQDIELNRLVNRHGKLGRAAAEREAQVAAGMARRGGASPDAVRGGGSRIGKSGKYTQKAGALANQRDKALGKFRGRASGSKSREAVQTPFGMYNKNAATKRKMQKAQAAFEKKARTGDFDISPSAKMHQMFARLNFQKRYGRLKGK